jgi:subtilisin family serine protease
MASGRRWSGAVAAALVCVLVSATSGAAAAPRDPRPPRAPKLAPVLAIDGPSEMTTAAASGANDEQPLVDVRGGDAAAVTEAIRAAGGEVRLTPPGSVLATVPRANLGALADDDRVSYVTRPHPVRSDATSQGVDNPGPGRLGATGAKAWQDGGRRGAGVKVAIVDVGFANLSGEIAAGRLPADVTTKNFCGASMVGFDGSGPAGTAPPISHGTAVAEIVHQMAPDAILTLVCIYYSSNGGDVEQYLAQNGITIVNASIGDVLDSRGDGTGPPNSLSGAVAAGRSAGQLWSVSAGNDALRHYTFTGSDADNDGRVEMFAGAPLPLVPDSTEGYSFSLASGQTANVQMKWDAWPATNQGFTICFYQDSFAGTKICPDFYGVSPPASPGKPVQQAAFTSFGSHTYQMVIERGNGTTITPRFDVWFAGSESNLAGVVAAGSATDPATSPFVMAMGAHYFASGQLESFSSQGPTIDGRTKPDLSGPDGVSNDVLTVFYGTSAAAPHGTGAAALIKGASPASTPDDIQAVLLARSVDAGASGIDNQYGRGRLNLGSLTFVASAATGAGAVSAATGETDAFVVGNDGGLWESTLSSAPATPWIPLGGVLTSDPDASSWGTGRVDVFARGADFALWHRWSNDGQTWGPWEPLGGLLLSGPTAVSRAFNRVDVFARGADNAVWTRSWTGTTWTAWSSLGGIVTSEPDVSAWASNRMDLFVRGTDNALYHRFWNGVGWSGWENLGGFLTSGPGAVSWDGNRIDVAVRGGDNALYTRAWNGVTWTGWARLGGVLTSSPDIAAPDVGQLVVLARGTDHAIYRNSYGGAWSGWSSIGPP